MLAQEGDALVIERPAGDALEALGRNAFGETQSHEQEFVGALGTGERFVAAASASSPTTGSGSALERVAKMGPNAM